MVEVKMMTKQEKEIDAGFPLEMDRYSTAACEANPRARMLAERYERLVAQRKYLNAPIWAKERMKAWVMEKYREIAGRVTVMPYDGHVLRAKTGSAEHYHSMEEMCDDYYKHHRIFMRLRANGPFVGARTQEWRLVHDVLGHVIPKAPFTYSGEQAAWTHHVMHDHIPRVCQPFGWNNVVVENVERLVRGEFLCVIKQCPSIIVFDEEEFGMTQEDFWRSA